jgi:2-methylcitrate dehydratase PrpD
MKTRNHTCRCMINHIIHISPRHYRLSREKKVAGDKLRKRIEFQKAPSYNKGKQADLHVTRVGVRGFKAPSDTNKSLPAGHRKKATNTSESQPLCEPTGPHTSYDTTRSTTFQEASSRLQSRQMTPITSSLRAHNLSNLRGR